MGMENENKNESLNKKIEWFALSATRWIGSPVSLVIHTLLFVSAFWLIFFGISLDQILLTVTTIVSFEAIYLSIFIQMTVNNQSLTLHEVRENIEEIQEDVEDIQEDVEDIQENVEEIQEDVEEINNELDDDDEEDIVSEKKNT